MNLSKREPREQVGALGNGGACPACGEAHGLTERCAPQPLHALNDVEFCQQPDPPWDIEGVTQQGTLEIGFGPSDSGKSTLFADRACCLVTSTPWLGMPVLRAGPVIVLCFEGRHAFKKKIRAWKAIHGFPADRPIGVYVVEDHVSFLDLVSVFELIKLVKRLGAHEVMVDTLAQSIGADEENQQMQTAVTHAALIRRLTGARVLFIHHTGKNRKLGARGGTALTAAADTVLSLDAEQDGHVLRCVRQRDGERFVPVFLTLTKTPDGSTVLFERRDERQAAALVTDKARERMRLQEAVLAYVREHPSSKLDAIAKGRRRQDVIAALADLATAGRVLAERNGRAKQWSACQQ